VAGLVGEYYVLLRSLRRTKPHLRECLTRCRHCRIFLFTHPRNAGRHDLRCAFGCREAHRKQESTRRSVAYYRDPEGRKKKAALNNRRRSPATSPAGTEKVGSSNQAPSRLSEIMVQYVRVVCSLIEGRRVSRSEVLEMLRKVLRQHSIGRLSKIDYIVRQLNQNPP
jgi:hypothetical protein